MTIAKSKYYMLKVNNQKIFESLEYEVADGSYDNNIPAATQPVEMDTDRLN